jgi:diadenosine tetraphosphate (Ap4A) HIT family hydrolase
VAAALRAAGVLGEPARVPFDPLAYGRQVSRGCFVCRLVQAEPGEQEEQILWRDGDTIAFLDRYPTVYGHVLVAPTAHREQVSGDLTLQQYLALQRVVHAVAEAVRLALKPERLYILSLGSQQANAHVHWHVVPCPPGTPLEEQQLALLDKEKRGILRLEPEEARVLAERLRTHLPAWMQRR